MSNIKSITVDQIKELSFNLDENVRYADSSDIDLVFNLDCAIQNVAQQIAITVGVKFLKKSDQGIMVSGKVTSIFNITFENPKNTARNLTDQTFITILSLAVSHTRAILARKTIGTVHEKLIIPIINPSKLYNDTLKKEFKIPEVD